MHTQHDDYSVVGCEAALDEMTLRQAIVSLTILANPEESLPRWECERGVVVLAFSQEEVNRLTLNGMQSARFDPVKPVNNE